MKVEIDFKHYRITYVLSLTNASLQWLHSTAFGKLDTFFFLLGLSICYLLSHDWNACMWEFTFEQSIMPPAQLLFQFTPILDAWHFSPLSLVIPCFLDWKTSSKRLSFKRYIRFTSPNQCVSLHPLGNVTFKHNRPIYVSCSPNISVFTARKP